MKSEIGVLKIFLTLEKYVNVHRDFSFFNRKRKAMVVLSVIVELIISVLLFTSSIRFQKLFSANLKLPYFPTAFLFVYIGFGFITAAFFGPTSGRILRQALKNLDLCHKFIRGDPALDKYLYRLKLRFYITIAIYAVTRIAGQTLQNLELGSLTRMPLMSAAITLFKMWIESRYLLEIFIYCAVIGILRSTVRYLTSLMKSCDKDAEGAVQNLETYSKVYQDMSICCEQLMQSLGPQMLASLTISIAHSISLVYRFIVLVLDLSNLGTATPYRLMNTYSVLVIYIFTTVMIARSGQSLQNESNKLNAQIARLRYIASTGPKTKYTRTLGDLHRMVRVRPVVVRLTPAFSQPVGMYILPAALTFTINYIIAVLQLNQDV